MTFTTEASFFAAREEKQMLHCPENDSPPQREEGLGVVGGTVSER
jgi:hypothetical protein